MQQRSFLHWNGFEKILFICVHDILVETRGAFEWVGQQFIWRSSVNIVNSVLTIFCKLMLFRSSDVIKIAHFHSTFLFFPFFCCCFQWTTIFNEKFTKLYKIVAFFPFRRCLFIIFLSFVLFPAERVVHILKWLAFSFFWDLFTIQRHNLISKSKPFKSSVESRLLHEN